MAQIRQLTGAVLVGAVAFTFTTSVAAQRIKGGPVEKRPLTQRQTNSTTPALECGDILGFQVLLDKQGFSVGQIDGKSGPNFKNAIAAFQADRKLAASGEPDCNTWQALGGEGAGAATASYTITEDDVKGPFVKSIPRSLPDQASLPALGYTSPMEKLAERFHTSPAMLQQLNHGARFTVGAEIKVPAVQPFDPDAPKPATDPAAAEITVKVSKDESALRATRADGTLVLLRARHDRQRKRSAARRRLEDHFGQLDADVQLQPGSFLGREGERHESRDQAGPQQSRRRRLDRRQHRALRHTRDPRAGTRRSH